jgi:hypothetical protein
MPRPLSALAAAGVAVLALVSLTATISSAGNVATPACTLLAAKSGILASDLPMRVKRDAAGREGTGIDRLVCRDLTYDDRKDMVASVYSGAVRVEAWVFFHAAAKGWRLAFRRTGLLRAHIRVSASAVIETDPIYKVGDKRPCCPTGGQKHIRFAWQRGKMVKVRAWHTGG